MDSSTLAPCCILQAQQQLASHLHRTPLVTSKLLNEWLGATIWFKLEGHQVTGSFKARGAVYALSQLQRKLKKPFRVALFSSGNHAQGCAWAGRKLNIPIEVFMPETTSSIKIQATRSYGAHVTLSPTRAQAEQLCYQAGLAGALSIPPFDNDDVIVGAGTSALECLQDIPKCRGIFATCGGGGLLSGTFLAAQALNSRCPIYGCEPLQACDAWHSLAQGKIFRFTEQPTSLADGARTPGVCERTFAFLRKLESFYLASEQEIQFWCQWLSHLLKTPVEPTAAVAMVGAWKHLRLHRTEKGPLIVILSGGNLSASCQQKIWNQSWLETLPSRDLQLDESMQQPLPPLLPTLMNFQTSSPTEAHL